MSDQMEDVKTAAAPPRKRRRAVVARPKPQPQEKANEFDGLTARDCCSACNEKRCIITGSTTCGHPFKASHPTAEPAVMARIAKVKKLLAHQKVGDV